MYRLPEPMKSGESRFACLGGLETLSTVEKFAKPVSPDATRSTFAAAPRADVLKRPKTAGSDRKRNVVAISSVSIPAFGSLGSPVANSESFKWLLRIQPLGGVVLDVSPK